MSDLWKTIEADASSFDDITTEGGAQLSELVRGTSEVLAEIVTAEEDLKALKRNRDRYLYDLIPAKMQEMGLDKVEVAGNKVSLQTFVSGTMPKDPLQRELALSHLREIGCEDFIKNEIIVSFGVKEDNRARSMQQDLEEQGFSPSNRTWVEPMTLKKLIRERVEASQSIDLEIFNANIGTVAKIKGA
mgnify:FL=1